MMPSPQTTFRVHGPCLMSGGQVQLGSTWHTPLQPSPGNTLPSSHCSGGWLIPSPQAGGNWALQPAVLVLLQTSELLVVPPDDVTALLRLMLTPPLPLEPDVDPPPPPWPLPPPAPPLLSIDPLVQAAAATVRHATKPTLARSTAR
jgi:hypothetical protein